MSPREERNGSRGRCTSPACQAISASWCTVPKWSLIHQRDKPAGRSGRLKRGGSEKIKNTVLYTLQYACQLILDTLLFSTLLLTFNWDHTDVRVCVDANWNRTSELEVIGFQFELERSAGHVTLSPRPVELMSKRPQVSTAIAHYKPRTVDFFSLRLADLEPGGVNKTGWQLRLRGERRVGCAIPNDCDAQLKSFDPFFTSEAARSSAATRCRLLGCESSPRRSVLCCFFFSLCIYLQGAID